jgi:hypothetical protein
MQYIVLRKKMTWKPKMFFSAEGTGRCPNCGEEIPTTLFLDQVLVVKGPEEPVDVSEPNFHCDNCNSDIVVDLELKLIINSQLFVKQVLTSDSE